MDCGVEQSWITCEKGKKYCVKEPDGSILVECVSNQHWTPQCKENEFLCYTGECISKEDVCNFKRNCSDGSDEMEEFCQIYEKYPDDKSKGSCLVKLPEHMEAYTDGIQIENHSYCKDGQQIAYTCAYGYLDLDAITHNLCSKGQFIHTPSNCEIRCDTTIFETANIQSNRIHCIDKNSDKLKTCAYSGIGTTAFLTCASGYQTENKKISSISTQCKEDGNWDASSQNTLTMRQKV